jgi:hypothetical protein
MNALDARYHVSEEAAKLAKVCVAASRWQEQGRLIGAARMSGGNHLLRGPLGARLSQRDGEG